MLKDERRRFNSRERVALYLASCGHCTNCGSELEPGWHADHMKAWSHGGPTDTPNGQALCPTCNLEKGNKNMHADVYGPDGPREWQKQAKRQYFADSMQDWLLYVTPGGGKTTWALSVAKDLLQDDVIDRIVIVVPTDNLRNQWKNHPAVKGRMLNLMLVSNEEGAYEKQSFDGCIVTYQQVASQPELYRRACKKRTLVIFDEAHHAGDSQTWGQGIETAFNLATRRISMTGTPWRAPRRGKIPFVRYNSDHEIIADFSFSYPQAIRAGVNRPVLFYPFDGEVTLINTKGDTCCMPQTRVSRLGEVEDDDSETLRAILNADGKWMPSILQKASDTLNDIRKEVSDAKGLIVVHDRSEARKVTKLIESITQEQPALVISNPEEGEPDPKDELERFAKNGQKWVVAVDMISEGVDIPPLYVCVYATRKKTQLRFLQIIGRVLRKRRGEDLPAVVFIPATPRFLELANEVENAILHVIKEIEEEWDEERKKRKEREPEIDEDLVLATSDAMRIGAITRGDSYHEKELSIAETKCLENGIPAMYAPSIIKMMRALGETIKSDTFPPSREEISLEEEYTNLRSLLNSQAKSAGGTIAQKQGIDIGVAIQVDVNHKRLPRQVLFLP